MGCYDTFLLKVQCPECFWSNDARPVEFQTRDIGEHMGEYDIGDQIGAEDGDYRRDAERIRWATGVFTCQGCNKLIYAEAKISSGGVVTGKIRNVRLYGARAD